MPSKKPRRDVKPACINLDISGGDNHVEFSNTIDITITKDNMKINKTITEEYLENSPEQVKALILAIRQSNTLSIDICIYNEFNGYVFEKMMYELNIEKLTIIYCSQYYLLDFMQHLNGLVKIQSVYLSFQIEVHGWFYEFYHNLYQRTIDICSVFLEKNIVKQFRITTHSKENYDINEKIKATETQYELTLELKD
jgi:hypothetical protein